MGELPTTRSEDIAHKCDVKTCVNPDHLERISHLQNVRDAFDRGLADGRIGSNSCFSKLTEQDVREIRQKYVPWKYPSTKLAKEYSVRCNTIFDIVKRKKWKHVI